MNWHGDWLPPPEEWAARKSFPNRHVGQEIEKRANGHSRSCTKPMDIQSPDFLGAQAGNDEWLNKELVPRYWLCEMIDDISPREFWKQAPYRAPAPLSDFDITDTPPYWERWNGRQPDDCFMATLVVPEARIDQDDKNNELGCPYAMVCVIERMAKIEQVKHYKERKRSARRNRPFNAVKDEHPTILDRQLRPKANIYLRPVVPADILGITVRDAFRLISFRQVRRNCIEVI